MGSWQDKVVLVTGGSSGLGRVIAETFAENGAKVAIVGLEAEAVGRVAQSLRDAGHDILGLHADITRQEDVDRIVPQAIDHFGRLDVLVNSAGRSMRGALLDTTPAQFQELMDLNLLGMVRCTRAAAPQLLANRGHVVNIGSLAAKVSTRWVGAYSATKHAVAAFSQQLRLELGPEGLHVLLVCPGPIARKDPRLYPLEGLEGIPESARAPGAGAKTKGIPPERVATAILRACERRKRELVLPPKVRLLFVLSALCPRLGDWLLLRNT